MIRQFTNSDLNGVREIVGHNGWLYNKWLLLFHLKYGKWIDRIQQCLSRKSLTPLVNDKFDRVTFISDEDDVINGYIHIWRYSFDVWFVGLFAVHSKYRRKGIGTRLLEKAISHVKEHEGKELRVIIDNERVSAIKTLEKLGFRTTGKQFSYVV